jgi:hypothetical protein
MVDIIIGGNTYFSYASVEEADIYLAVWPNTENWFLLDEDGKGKNLVAATNWLNQLKWKDECLPLDTNEGVINATIMIANSIANGDTAFLGGTVQEAGTKRLKAGSAEIEFFANISSFYQSPNNPLTLLPPLIRGLIFDCLEGSNTSGIGGSIAFGTHYPSTAKEPWDFYQ